MSTKIANVMQGVMMKHRAWQRPLITCMSKAGYIPFPGLLLFSFCILDALLCPKVWRMARDGSFDSPCPMIKPALCLWLYAMQSQPCFPTASKFPFPPRWQQHFHSNADRAYNTLHFASKAVCQGASPFGNPRQQNRLNTSHFPALDVQPLFVVSSPRFVVCV